MSRTLLLNVEDAEERRAVLLEEGRASLLWVEREDQASRVGNVYKGRVLHVEPSIGAAFVDVGLERPGFLHADDVMAVLADPEADLMAYSARERGGAVPAIDTLLAPGREIVVQVTRDAIAHKGPTLTTHLSLAGRALVLLPSLERVGVSRRINDPEVREGLRALAASLAAPDGLGWVVRTSAATAGHDRLQEEADALLARHAAIGERARESSAPAVLHTEADFVSRAVRELVSRAPDGAGGPTVVIADTEEAVECARAAAPPGTRVELHSAGKPLLHAFGAESAVRKLSDPRVQLRGGAFLVIQETEALWSIDVNSGRMRKGKSLEETALETDLLAAKEVARQIRLRDLGGLIVVDFIDCRDPENRARIEEVFRAEAAKDPARMRFAAMSEFMVLEITRRRLRSGPGRAGAQRCLSCNGYGRVQSPESAGLAALRDLRALLAGARVERAVLTASPEVAENLDARRAQLDALEDKSGAQIDVREDATMRPDQFDVRRG